MQNLEDCMQTKGMLFMGTIESESSPFFGTNVRKKNQPR
jgi:hypothetical protein